MAARKNDTPIVRSAIYTRKSTNEGLEQEINSLDAQREAADGETVTDRMADLQDRIRSAEQRATQVREELIALGRESIDERDVADALSRFDPVWENLSPREQARLIQLLVERVEYDGGKETVSVTFHQAGIKTLAGQIKDKEA